MFLEFNCGHFETKMESLRPSYQKLGFYHIWAWAWLPHSVSWKELGWQLFSGDSGDSVQYFDIGNTPQISHKSINVSILSHTAENH